MMGQYEAVLYDRPKWGDPRPVTIEGREVKQEIVAETHSKARWQFLSDLRDAWGDEIRFQDIRVKSLRNQSVRRDLQFGWAARQQQVHAIIRVIGSHGRHFLSENSDHRALVENPFFAHFRVDDRRELWYVDRYSRKDILVRHSEWPGFSDGGTLRDLIKHFADYISGEAKEINMRHFGPFPEWSCGGDLWGYGKDEMQKVRYEIASILKENTDGKISK